MLSREAYYILQAYHLHAAQNEETELKGHNHTIEKSLLVSK